MNPYIVTVKRRGNNVVPRVGRKMEVLSRRAVATLEEARTSAAEAVFEHIGYEENLGYRRRPLSTPAFTVACHDLTESGGTVGPLPDGTVIEVEKLSPLMLASRCGASGELMMGCLRSDDWQPLLTAYNEAQEADVPQVR